MKKNKNMKYEIVEKDGMLCLNLNNGLCEGYTLPLQIDREIIISAWLKSIELYNGILINENEIVPLSLFELVNVEGCLMDTWKGKKGDFKGARKYFNESYSGRYKIISQGESKNVILK